MKITSVLLLITMGISCKNYMHGASAKSRDTMLVPVFRAAFPPLLRESSGLCFTDGQLWTFNDSGNPNEIYKIDTSTGAILQTVTLANYPNRDWEDITADSLYIYIGDSGNNRGDRKDLKILRIKKSDLKDTASSLTVQAEAICYSYADQKNFIASDTNNFDCESLMIVNDYLYLFTKDRGDFKTRCYQIPAIPGTYRVSPVSSFDVQGKITAAAYNSKTREVALLGYLDKKEKSFIWLLNNYRGDRFFSGTAARFIIGNQVDWQTEGLDYISGDRFFLSCESSKSHPAGLYSVQRQ